MEYATGYEQDVCAQCYHKGQSLYRYKELYHCDFCYIPLCLSHYAVLMRRYRHNHSEGAMPGWNQPYTSACPNCFNNNVFRFRPFNELPRDIELSLWRPGGWTATDLPLFKLYYHDLWSQKHGITAPTLFNALKHNGAHIIAKIHAGTHNLCSKCYDIRPYDEIRNSMCSYCAEVYDLGGGYYL